MVTDKTENKRETVRHGDFYSGCVEVIKGSGFVNSRQYRQVRNSESRERSIRQTDVQKEFNV
ncbi:hypothetical protein B7P43_G04653 [Cryptotermes secundus]|uniref:Uncharacterized protein n=1 Tax=Cryptotermes secundus TaxID=105785 RepID=A0A2J7QZG7_9NEOP|nr:hypothetical protein B7P43_G04653 [Cryptotermes secundus]